MSQPAPIPTIDVTEADRRLREDPDRPLLLDVREADEFAAVRAPGRGPRADVAVHDPRGRAADRSARSS